MSLIPDIQIGKRYIYHARACPESFPCPVCGQLAGTISKPFDCVVSVICKATGYWLCPKCGADYEANPEGWWVITNEWKEFELLPVPLALRAVPYTLLEPLREDE